VLLLMGPLRALGDGTIDNRSSGTRRRLPGNDQALGDDGDNIEAEAERARGGHVGPRPAVRRVRRGRDDVTAESVLQTAEVLGDDGGDDAQRRGDLEAREDERKRV